MTTSAWRGLVSICAMIVGLWAANPAIGLAEEGAAADVIFQERGHGFQLVDAKGMALYTFERDQEPGKSACNGPCAELWPPLTASAGDEASGDWTLITRVDGTRQWAYRGKPLYRYSKDVSAGDSYGDGVDGEWAIAMRLIDTPVSASISKTLLGHVLIDARRGTTLYVSSADKPGKSTCNGACTRTWLPLVAPLMAVGAGDWKIVVRDDGTRQWSYKEKPLYRFVGDVNPGDTLGHEAEGKKWQALILEPAPPLPAWVTIQGSDAGEVLADAQGRTLYGRNEARIRRPRTQRPSVQQQIRPGYANPGEERSGAAKESCGVECPGSNWRPVLASPADKPFGNWSLVERADGKRQWAYKGEPLYTHARDKFPGALNGVRSGDRSWHALMRSGQRMQGTGT